MGYQFNPFTGQLDAVAPGGAFTDAISFSNNTTSTPTRGIGSLSTADVSIYTSGARNFAFSGGSFQLLAASCKVQLVTDTSPEITLGASSDVRLTRAGPDILALRRTTNPQDIRISGTYTDDLNQDYVSLKKAAGGDATISSQGVGTGTGGSLVFAVPITAGAGVSATAAWKIGAGASAGAFLGASDNTYDLGATGGRPRDLVLGRNATIGGSLTVTGQITGSSNCVIGAASDFRWSGGNRLFSSGGVVLVRANDGTTPNPIDASNYHVSGTAGATGGTFTTITSITVNNGIVTAISGT